MFAYIHVLWEKSWLHINRLIKSRSHITLTDSELQLMNQLGLTINKWPWAHYCTGYGLFPVIGFNLKIGTSGLFQIFHVKEWNIFDSFLFYFLNQDSLLIHNGPGKMALGFLDCKFTLDARAQTLIWPRINDLSFTLFLFTNFMKYICNQCYNVIKLISASWLVGLLSGHPFYFSLIPNLFLVQCVYQNSFLVASDTSVEEV